MKRALKSIIPLILFALLASALSTRPCLAQARANIVILDIAQSPAKIFPGQNFTETFSLTNAGDAPARMVQLSMTIPDPFAIIGSSSNFFIGDLESGEYHSVVINMSVDKKAAVGVYSIPFTIQYENSTGRNYEQEGTFGVQIFGEPKLLVDTIIVDPPSLTPGQTGLMTIRLTNVGTDAASNASMKVFGGRDILANSFEHIAKIESQKSKSIIFPISLDGSLEPGTYLLNITVSYRDDLNNSYHLSKLHEFKVLAITPFIPHSYIALAVGIVLLALGGYFLYTWKPEDSRQESKTKNTTHMRTRKSSKKGKQTGKKVLIIPGIITVYILLLVPYLFHANLENAGIITYSNEITFRSLPEDVQEICRLRELTSPVVLLVKHLQPDWVTMVITSRQFSPGTVVEMSDYVVNWRVDWRDFNYVGQTFQRFAIANVRKLGPFESSIEMLFFQLGWIVYDLSKVDFYAGPILVIFCLTVLLQGRLALWNLPAVLSCYSLQIWRLNALAYEHNIAVAVEMEYFGYAFVALLPLAVYAWHFERSSGGRSTANKMKALSHALGLLRE